MSATSGKLQALLGLAVMLAVPRVGAQERHEYRQLVMGVEARLVLHAPDVETARRAASAAFARLEALDLALSDYRVDGELARLAQAAATRPRRVSPDLLAVLAGALDLARVSGGALDPTVAPLVALHREARARGALPEPEAAAAALAVVDWRAVALDASDGTALLSRPGMGLDLGAVAKGYAADQALDLLVAAGCPSALVELGGDLALGAAPPGTAGWRVAVGCPAPGRPPRVLSLSHVSVATSGDTEQFVELDGVTYSHLLDPRSGAPLTDRRCATVIAGDGLLADGLSSACRVLGPRAGRALVASHAGARLIVDDPRDVALFDGATLDGWSTVGGRYDGHASWAVEDGLLVGRVGPRGTGGLLYVAPPARDHHLELEVRIDHPFDSGVFLRMAPEGRGLQVTLDDRPGGEIGAIYADGFLAHNPDGERLWRRGGWNHLELEVSGDDMRVRAWLNGALLVEHALPAGSEGFAPEGLIGLQVHGGLGEDPDQAVRFREIVARPLP